MSFSQNVSTILWVFPSSLYFKKPGITTSFLNWKFHWKIKYAVKNKHLNPLSYKWIYNLRLCIKNLSQFYQICRFQERLELSNSLHIFRKFLISLDFSIEIRYEILSKIFLCFCIWFSNPWENRASLFDVPSL